MATDGSAALRARLRAAFEINRHPLTATGGTRGERDGLVVETLEFETATGERVRGLVFMPPDVTAGATPALLYVHAHGNRYDVGLAEMTDGRPALASPLAPALARAGFLVMGIELPAFGTRQSPGEGARAKALLWRGRSLAGQMMGEQAAAFAILAARPEVDPGRIGVVGLSMGATLACWLAAVEERIACVAHMCSLANVATLIETGAHDLHGIYLTVPGLLDIAGNGAIAGLVAPRSQFVGIGAQDPLTPPVAFARAFAELEAAYAEAPGRLVLHREPDEGHRETAAMRAALLAFLARQLGRAS